MNPTHLHLLLNHFPIIGTLIGSGMLLSGLFLKSQHIKLHGLMIIVIMALIAIPVFLSGEPAEEAAENVPGISKSIIENHEEAAEIAFWLMETTGFIALISFFLHYRKPVFAGFSFIAVLLFSVVTFGAMVRTGYLGGQIRHAEKGNNMTGNLNQQNESKEDENGEQGGHQNNKEHDDD